MLGEPRQNTMTNTNRQNQQPTHIPGQTLQSLPNNNIHARQAEIQAGMAELRGMLV